MRRPRPVRQTIAVVAAVLLALGATPALASNDPLFSQQWALAKIHAEEAWPRSTGAGVTVAVVDTGVNFAHEDLQGASAGSYTCIETCVESGDDDFGHGTAVAGIIAARANNGVGIAGVAPEAKILSIKTLDKEGVGSIDDVAMAIQFATEKGAKVINLSLGSDLPTSLIVGLLTGLLGGEDPLQKAINVAAGQGAVVIAAAGNSGLAPGFLGLDNLILVGATGPDDQIAGYSSSLLGVSLHAPGGEASGECDPSHCILTTDWEGGYESVQGTSFAAPHVSGVVAQLMALGYTPLGATARLLTTADSSSGVSRLNAASALQSDPLPLPPVVGAAPDVPGAPGPEVPGLPAPGVPEPGVPEPGVPEPGVPEPGVPAPDQPAPGTPGDVPLPELPGLLPGLPDLGSGLGLPSLDAITRLIGLGSGVVRGAPAGSIPAMASAAPAPVAAAPGTATPGGSGDLPAAGTAPADGTAPVAGGLPDGALGDVADARTPAMAAGHGAAAAGLPAPLVTVGGLLLVLALAVAGTPRRVRTGTSRM
jgi:subtilisin family serine protease